MIDTPPRCLMCKRLLDQPGVPESLDCGGDCLGCIRDIEDDRPMGSAAMTIAAEPEGSSTKPQE
jgi:hypothetical protein